jgi:hypothetical protein
MRLVGSVRRTIERSRPERAVQLDCAQRLRDRVIALALESVEDRAEVAPRRDA